MTTVQSSDGNDPVSRYAWDVVEGRELAGQLVIAACQRHLDDLRTGHERGLVFSVSAAETALRFWALCPHLKGRDWAGQNLALRPWQQFIVGSAYGWKRSNGMRRFRVIWTECGRKNGKSSLVYPAALYGLIADGEPGAEVYSVATKKDQAKLVFDLARQAVTKKPYLLNKIYPYKHYLETMDRGSKFEALGADADTLDGLSPSTVIADEIHQWVGRQLWDVIETGMGARAQPLLWAITTAGPEGSADVYGQEHDYTVSVLQGTVQDDSRFGYIACLDPGDDWTDARLYGKANPNLGVSLRLEELAQAGEKAQASPPAALAFKRLRLGIRSQDADAWLPLPVWDELADERVRWEKFKGAVCYGGLDLASTSDFAALALLFPLAADFTPAVDPTNPAWWGLVWRYWIPSEGKYHGEKKLREIIEPWVAGGWVQRTPGDIIDHDQIEADVKAIATDFGLRGLCYDPFNATQLATHLQEAGIEVVKFPQAMTCFAEPTKRFEEFVINKRLRHDGNPCSRWMASNVTLVVNAAGHRMPSRKRSKNKIDGIVAAIMGVGRALAAGKATPSYYDTNEFEVI